MELLDSTRWSEGQRSGFRGVLGTKESESGFQNFVIGRWGHPSGCAMNAVQGYRAKAWECLSLAESVNDPQRRADMLRFARMWMSLTEPMDQELRGAYELPPRNLAA